MIALLAPILQAVWRPLAALLGGLGAYLKGRSDAKAAAETAQMIRDLHVRDQRDAIDRAAAATPDPVGELRRDFSRPEPVRPVAPDPDRRGG